MNSRTRDDITRFAAQLQAIPTGELGELAHALLKKFSPVNYESAIAIKFSCARCGAYIEPPRRKWCSKTCFGLSKYDPKRLATAERLAARVCPGCGGRVTDTFRTWCSTECRLKSRLKPVVDMNCGECGVPIFAPRKRWCSKKCEGRHWWRILGSTRRRLRRQGVAA